MARGQRIKNNPIQTKTGVATRSVSHRFFVSNQAPEMRLTPVNRMDQG